VLPIHLMILLVCCQPDTVPPRRVQLLIQRQFYWLSYNFKMLISYDFEYCHSITIIQLRKVNPGYDCWLPFVLQILNRIIHHAALEETSIKMASQSDQLIEYIIDVGSQYTRVSFFRERKYGIRSAGQGHGMVLSWPQYWKSSSQELLPTSVSVSSYSYIFTN
jgi:hypothetical protein